MKVLITGGAGFVGSNLAKRLMESGNEVRILDNLSRKGTDTNLEWLKKRFGDFEFSKSDIRVLDDVEKAVKGVDVVFHLAAQVAVTTSVVDPRLDFDVNLRGTFNLLEAIRKLETPPMILFSSTNKVYGKMDSEPIIERNGRWEYQSLPYGNPETTSLDFYSPYGCSKGAADQYIHDYGRIYSIPTTVFRMSCIYGPRQMGCEDQGWVAFFLIQAVLGKALTIYGDGKQIRDVLYIDDLVDAFLKAYQTREKTIGQVYNIGGGPEQTLSLLETIETIETSFSLNLPYQFANWRPGDQKVYVSDIRKASAEFGWSPKYKPADGLKKLHDWIDDHRSLFESPYV
ncbi:GDP-mannose 4,6-dehydratase [bacterium]|nr:GDP-mannose 4,6-dehydratase [candidate division CSSED10-310 bacterium]